MDRRENKEKEEKNQEWDAIPTSVEYYDACEQALPKDKGWAWMCLLGKTGSHIPGESRHFI